MAKGILCARCGDSIKSYDDLVIYNNQPHHFNCYKQIMVEYKNKNILYKIFIGPGSTQSGKSFLVDIVLFLLMDLLLLGIGYYGGVEIVVYTAFITPIIVSIMWLYRYIKYKNKLVDIRGESKILSYEGNLVKVIKFRVLDFIRLFIFSFGILNIGNIVTIIKSLFK